MFSSLGLDDKHDEMIIGVRLKLRSFEFLVQLACGSIIGIIMVLCNMYLLFYTLN